MAYVGGTENEFKGFGATADDSFRTSFEATCAAMGQKSAECRAYYDKKYAGIRAASKAFIEKHEKDSRYGHVLAQVLDGASDPEAIGERARALADQFSSDAFEKSAYQFLYSQARTGFEIADQYLSMYPEAAALGVAIKSGEHLYYEGKSIFQKYEGTSLDAAGVGDVMNLMKKSVVTARGLAKGLGVQEGSVVDEVMDWAIVATSCGAAIAVGSAAAPGWGTVGGAVTCAVSALLKVFGLMRKEPSVPKRDLKTMIFARFEPHDSQRGLIAADAARLAALLRYRYGVQSWYTLWNKAPTTGDGWDMLRTYTHRTTAIAVGFTPTQTLQIMGGSLPYPGMPGLSEIAQTPAGVDFLQEMGGLNIAHMVKLANSLPPGYPQLEGVKDWAELVTFFAAITCRELSVDAGYIRPWSFGLPIRFWNIDHVTGKLLDATIAPGQQRYSDHWWAPGKSIDSLITRVSHLDDPDALYEFGCLRLAAAFSYLRMNEKWGERQESSMASLRSGKDVLDLDPLDTTIPASGLRVPVETRRTSLLWKGKIPSIQQLFNRITEKAVLMDSIAARARADAQADFRIVQLAGEAKRKILLAQEGAPVASMYKDLPAGVRLLQEGRVEMSEKLKCTQSGYTWDPTNNLCDYSKPYVPPDAKAKPTGVGGLAVVGAAALLGLFFLRR